MRYRCTLEASMAVVAHVDTTTPTQRVKYADDALKFIMLGGLSPLITARKRRTRGTAHTSRLQHTPHDSGSTTRARFARDASIAARRASSGTVRVGVAAGFFLNSSMLWMMKSRTKVGIEDTQFS